MTPSVPAPQAPPAHRDTDRSVGSVRGAGPFRADSPQEGPTVTYEQREVPPRAPSLSTALRRHWAAALAVLTASVVASLVWASLVPVQHVAHAQVIAGATSVNAAAVPSFTEAGKSLAETYSRVFEGDAVRAALADAVGDSRVDVAASPIAGSSVILIEATAPTAQEAVRAADAGVDALVAVVAQLLDNQPAVDAATADLAEAHARLSAAESALEAAQSTDGAPDVLAAASAEVVSARAAVDAYNGLLTDVISDSVQSNGVQRLVSAEVVSDTVLQRFQLRAAIGLVVGTVLAAGLAYALTLAESRRRSGHRRDPDES